MDYNPDYTDGLYGLPSHTTPGADWALEYAPLPIASTPEDSPLAAIIPLLDDPQALVGPSGDETLLMEYNGVDYHIPADMDTESATLTDGQGMNILADTDGDGRIDYVSSIDYNGNWSAWRWSTDVGGALGVGENSDQYGHGEDGTTAGDGTSPHSWASTPDMGKGKWEVGAWKCVERGEWG
ncbi:hypothetical protein GC425_08730 [Corynebacterium sp. zg254]|uniref:DUF6802 domain-containing protein n=1 Tax=Corynebacterium zhongnanshanii TaxID=2768834 RepID=A0ABQ6VCU2_9CORY|nr:MULTISPECIES: DUF6802 family protein [Corynebacterium]KAB3519985.1 hypothetical protein F8377_08770 [Corynebacterium zhongnanshanii]MCR5914935.1 hypothetical protein [Corynebacterium sp. zg254]